MIELITFFLGVLLAATLWGGITLLPGERGQMMAAMPVKKNPDGSWQGINLTYYGALTASAYVMAVFIFALLTASQQTPLAATLLSIVLLLALCMPASKLIARMVEKKKHTFSVGGASFAGIIAAPWIIILSNSLARAWQLEEVAALPLLAAMAIAYAFGEGLGRLACISFGCCYGKPLAQAPAWLRRLLPAGLVLRGKTKKAAYADDLEGVELIPVQAMTAILFCAVGLLGFYLYLKGYSRAAMVITIAVTQGWRLVSEVFRADFRGAATFTAYQMMSVVAMIYVTVLVAMLAPGTAVNEEGIKAAFNALGTVPFIGSLQLLWLIAFLYSGRSEVTGATLNFHVCRERI